MDFGPALAFASFIVQKRAPRCNRAGSETIEFIESRLERKFQLEINREKTRVVDLREERASLNFLGFSVLQKFTGKEVAWPN